MRARVRKAVLGDWRDALLSPVLELFADSGMHIMVLLLEKTVLFLGPMHSRTPHPLVHDTWHDILFCTCAIPPKKCTGPVEYIWGGL